MMNRALIFALAALPLAACVPTAVDTASPVAPVEGERPYMAIGTEPGWTLEITGATLKYDGDYGDTRINVANPGARPRFNGSRYVTDRMSVDITHSVCSDGMSDRLYTDTVTVITDGKTVKGCGGPVLPPANLDGTQWRILSINGTDVVGEPRAEVRFSNGDISGSAGCNRFNGTYVADGKRLTTGQLMTTRMGCPEPQNAQEVSFFALMAKPVSIRFTPEGRMILMGEGGHAAVLERVI